MNKKIKSILISQPKPENGKTYYQILEEKYHIKIDFRPFVEIQGVPAREFRQNKINISDFTAVVITSKNAADHFFRIAEEMRYQVPETIRYFCLSEAIAFYLQKYIPFRKRKIFYGNGTLEDLASSILKYKQEKFLVPCSEIHKQDILNFLKKHKIKHEKAILYRTVCSDLSDLKNINYDMICFFSPAGISSLFKNFPDFKQNDTKIAVFGETTAKAAKKHGLKVDIKAPTENAPSMSAAIENYIKNNK